MHTGNKKYSCDFCQRLFTKRNTLNNHRRLHTGEKPFLCPAVGCGMSFVQRTACKTHARKKHGITITVYTRNPEVPRGQPLIPPQRVKHEIQGAVAQGPPEVRPELAQEARQELHRYETIITESGTRLMVEPEHMEHLEVAHLISRSFHQGQTVEIAQLPQGQIVHIIQPIQQVREEDAAKPTALRIEHVAGGSN